MSEKPKRRRFWQIHLSTAVLLMLSSAGFLWLNATPNYSESRRYAVKFGEEYYGWPRAFVRSNSESSDIVFLSGFSNIGAYWPECGLNFAFWCILPDVCVFLASLAAVAFVSESVLRRREARKT